jgi:hypothetical protein
MLVPDAVPPPRSRGTTTARARAAPPACRLGLAGLTTRDAFDWIDPNLSGRKWLPKCSTRAELRATGTPFHESQLPAHHGNGSPLLATALRCRHRRNDTGLQAEGTSHQSLQPTCCQRAPVKSSNSRALGSHRHDQRLWFCPFTRTWVHALEQHHQPLASDSRKRHLRPRVVPRLVPRTPAVAMNHRSQNGTCRP